MPDTLTTRADSMGKKKGPGRPPTGKPPARQISVRIPSDLDARLKAFLRDQPVEPTDTAVLLEGLDLFLTQEGYPPAKPKSGGQ
jgi:hypothetical protein